MRWKLSKYHYCNNYDINNETEETLANGQRSVIVCATSCSILTTQSICTRDLTVFLQYLKSKVSSQAMLEDSSSESEEEEQTETKVKLKLKDKQSEVSRM